MLNKLRALKARQLLEPAAALTEEELQRLVGLGADAVAQLSETELLARLIQGEPTQAVRTKTLLLATWLKEAGELAAAQGRAKESRSYYLKGLHLLLHALAGSDAGELPEFVPKIESIASSFDQPLPLESAALLMQHYERTGQFAKAEDALFGMLETEPGNGRVVEFGLAFYQRLECQSDAALEAGDLPRSEVEAGLAELQARKRALEN